MKFPKLILLLLLLICVNFKLNSQTKIDSLKLTLKHGIQKFIDSTKNVNDYKYINPYYFDQILAKINSKTTARLFELDSLNNISIYFSINARDTSFSYEYQDWNQNEHYYKNCSSYHIKNIDEANVIYGSCGNFNLISIDTISNIIITKPTKSSYEVFRSLCPGRLTKDKATKEFMSKILGQYQLVIYLNNVLPRTYFIAPPNPNNKFGLKHTTGSF